jgi:hypothetical protein
LTVENTFEKISRERINLKIGFFEFIDIFSGTFYENKNKKL